MINLLELINAARCLRTEDHANPEYDRALVELIRDVSPLDRDILEEMILGDRYNPYIVDLTPAK